MARSMFVKKRHLSESAYTQKCTTGTHQETGAKQACLSNIGHSKSRDFPAATMTLASSGMMVPTTDVD